jgi:hypothetical protein
MSFKEETLEMTERRGQELTELFIKEVNRLLNSGTVDSESHNRALLFGVAIENIADNFLRGERKSKEYKNLKCF